ncbi:MAG: hypothetical protein ACJAYG_002532 [Oceanicoccus sp.]|jgi:hypothetical protein
MIYRVSVTFSSSLDTIKSRFRERAVLQTLGMPIGLYLQEGWV